MTAAEWNARYGVGTEVVYAPHRAARPPERRRTRTRSDAWTLGHGEPVVAVEGKAGGVALWAVTPLEEVPRCRCRLSALSAEWEPSAPPGLCGYCGGRCARA